MTKFPRYMRKHNYTRAEEETIFQSALAFVGMAVFIGAVVLLACFFVPLS